MSCSWPHSRAEVTPSSSSLPAHPAGSGATSKPMAEGTTFLLLKCSLFPLHFPCFPSAAHAGTANLLEALNSCRPSSYLPPSFRVLEDCRHGGGRASCPGRDTRLWLKRLIHAQAPEAAQIKEASQTSTGLKAGYLPSDGRGGKGMGTAPLRSTARTGARSCGWTGLS